MQLCLVVSCLIQILFLEGVCSPVCSCIPMESKSTCDFHGSAGGPLIMIGESNWHRGLTQSQCGVILYDSCQ